MLSTILSSHRPKLAELAEGWLTAGATAFSIWDQGHLLAHWPPLPAYRQTYPQTSPQNEHQIVAPVRLAGEIVGELRVSGLNGALIQPRLAAEANLVAELVKLEGDLENMTAELIEVQDQLLAMYNLTHITRSHLNIDQTLRLLADEARRILKTEGVFILLNAADPVLVEQSPAALFDEATLKDLFKQVGLNKKEVLLSCEDIPDLGLLCVSNLFLKPISIRSNINAILGILFDQPAASLSPSLKLARAIAEYAGAQIENALLHQETVEQARLKTELELAARIQLQLLPQQPPRVPGLDISAKSWPAREVGGDFYDFIAPAAGPFTFAVGDVSGKGMSAAMLMTMTRTVIRSKATSVPTRTPETVLSYSNELMYDDFTDVGMFATVFIGQYSPTEGELRYANAGHSPVIYCPAGGPAYLLEADGPAMGVLPASLSEEESIPFNPGDILVIATDGFNEARNATDEMFGYDRLLQFVQHSAGRSAAEIVQALNEAVREFSDGQPQDDDQTLLIIKGTKA